MLYSCRNRRARFPSNSPNPDPIQQQPRDTTMTWTKPASHFARFQNGAKYTAAGRSLPSALDPWLSSTRRDRARIHKHKGRRMSKRLIWVDGDNFTGWCCSHCTWGLALRISKALSPRSPSTGLRKRRSRSTPASARIARQLIELDY